MKALESEKKLTITINIFLNDEESELFEATDEESLIGQADMVSDFLREPTKYGHLNWTVK